MSPFLSSLLPFILHVRALLGAAGPWPNWGLKPPSCKVVGCQASSDLQLGAHAMPLLLWAIKGKWERNVQIPLVILTYILSNGVEWLHELTITTWWKEEKLPGRNREPMWGADWKSWDRGLIRCSCTLYIEQSITFLFCYTTQAPHPCPVSNNFKYFLRCLRQKHMSDKKSVREEPVGSMFRSDMSKILQLY